MATSVKYQNISVQPTTVPRAARTVYELPRINLTEAELSRKSTSDRTKRRVAHKARYPRPVITKPVVVEKPPRKQIKKLMFKKDGTVSRVIFESRKSTSDSTKRRLAHEPEVIKTAAEKAQQKQIKMPVLNKDGTVSRVKTFEGRKSTSDSTKCRAAHVPEVTKPASVVPEKAQQNQINKLVLKKDGGTWSVKPREVKQTTQRVVVDSARAEHSRSSSSGFDDRVKAFKRKPESLSVDEVYAKKQKKGVDDGVVSCLTKEKLGVCVVRTPNGGDNITYTLNIDIYPNMDRKRNLFAQMYQRYTNRTIRHIVSSES